MRPWRALRTATPTTPAMRTPTPTSRKNPCHQPRKTSPDRTSEAAPRITNVSVTRNNRTGLRATVRTELTRFEEKAAVDANINVTGSIARSIGTEACQFKLTFHTVGRIRGRGGESPKEGCRRQGQLLDCTGSCLLLSGKSRVC